MSWSIEKSRTLYRIKNWSEGYVDVNEEGSLCVYPDRAHAIHLPALIKRLQDDGIALPLLLRFSDILKDRVTHLIDVFHYAMERCHYRANFIAAYPIKVNQQRRVIEDIVAAGNGNVGLESGSKPELLINIALATPGSTLICNGYKDREYIELALTATQLGFNVFIVIEKLSELPLLIDCIRQSNCLPQLGIRVRLTSIASGNWQNTGGEKSKFGLHANQILKAIETLKQHDLLSCLQLLHFHIGSQIAVLNDLKQGLTEGVRYYVQLKKMGVPINTLDVGGGLGVDYEGTQSTDIYSMNYSVSGYANAIVTTIYDICQHEHIDLPDIVTESGRAMTAHHAMLITNIIDTESPISLSENILANSGNAAHPLLQDYANLHRDIHANDADTNYKKNCALLEMAKTAFANGELSLEQWARLDECYYAICHLIQQSLPKQHTLTDSLHVKLADKYFANFSVFQTIPDTWAIDQVFPIVPLQRLDQKPTRHCIIQDLTCDSDGRIDHYMNANGSTHSLPVHELTKDEPYLIGLFLVGAYQEILGDIHNLFGDSASINIAVTEHDEVEFSEYDHGDTVSDLFQTIHMDPEQLKQRYRELIDSNTIKPEQQASCLQRLLHGLDGYTYLED